MIKFGKTISADQDNFVRYGKYGKEFVVIKGLFMGLDDSKTLYDQEIKFQEALSAEGFAPRLLKKNIKADKSGRTFMVWVSEDAGLPIEEEDVPAANKLLDELYERGIVLSFLIDQRMFVKGFDGKIRVTDFKHAEIFEDPILKDKRVYIQWKA